MNYKHGQKVKCEIEGVKVNDARISIDRDGDIYICQNERNGAGAEDKLGYKYSWWIKNGSNDKLKLEGITNLCSAERTLRDMVVGDVIVDKEGYIVKVLAICGEAFLRSFWDDFNRASCSWYTFTEAENAGWKLKEEPQKVREITMKEVCEKFGEEVKIKEE